MPLSQFLFKSKNRMQNEVSLFFSSLRTEEWKKILELEKKTMA